MPSHRIHKKVNKMLLGKEHEDVNKLLDFPYAFLGPKHRVVLHDKKTPFIVLALTGDIEKALAAYIHIKTDEIFSKLSRRRRKCLEKILANL